MTSVQRYRRAWVWSTHVIVISLILLGSGCASAPSEIPENLGSTSPIGVIDIQRLLAETTLGKQVNETMKSFMNDRQALIELEQQDLRKREEDLLRQGSVLSTSAKKQKEEQFRRRMLEYQKKVTEMKQEVQAKQEALFAEFRTKIESVMAHLARERRLVLVLEKGQNTPTRYHHPELDLTNDVIQELQRTGK